MISIMNGFSFGREKKLGDVDLFFYNRHPDVENQIKSSIEKYKPNRIWVTLIYDHEAIVISRITDERWILGGPLVSQNINNEKFHKYFIGNPTFVYTTMEEYLGKPISSDFDPYFVEFVENNYPNYGVVYSLSTGNIECYWSKCIFCSFKNRETTGLYKRKDVEKIFGSAIEHTDKNRFIGYNCVSSINEDLLTKMLSIINKKKVLIHAYMRADKRMLKVIKQQGDMSKCFFTIGLEAFSQKVLDELNKGINFKTIFEVTEELLKRGAMVRFTLMGGYTFLTREIVDESIENIKEFKRIYSGYLKSYVRFFSGIPVIWNEKESAEKYGYKAVPLKKVIPCPEYISDDCCISYIPENSEQYSFNKEIEDAIKQSLPRDKHLTFTINKSTNFGYLHNILN